jgi:uncharacterized protein Usg
VLVVAPVFQEYEVAPETVNVALAPEQIAVEEAEALTVGVVLTDKLIVLVFEQPEVVPVTVKIVVARGETETVLVVAPVFQEYDVAPEAVKVEVLPEQIAEKVDEILTVGDALTTMFVVAVPLQLGEAIKLTV